MRPIGTLVAFAVAAFTALALTFVSVAGGGGFGTVRIGVWQAGPKHGTADADPYTRAAFARLGALPVGLADGLVFVARRDGNGRPLDGRCTVRVSGRIPQARFWTITVTDGDGELIDNPAARHGITSAEAVWSRDGTIEIVAAPRARAGNWLPTAGRGRIVFVLRLYDTPVGFATRASDAPVLPGIAQEGCP